MDKSLQKDYENILKFLENLFQEFLNTLWTL